MRPLFQPGRADDLVPDLAIRPDGKPGTAGPDGEAGWPTLGGLGVVGAAGGLGGFVPPLVMGSLYGAYGSYALGLVLLAVVAAAALAFTGTGVRHAVTRRGPSTEAVRARGAVDPRPRVGHSGEVGVREKGSNCGGRVRSGAPRYPGVRGLAPVAAG
ncbi:MULTISPECIES: hypothetical protein [unclassified Streptomyces]|uniref:hypothetical protein n=1 Tax=unclassified Streptomyces TaxID=2593676 RepID=UPI0021E067D4|nr:MULTISPECIES: hypothetical protein [unclassified Streptomyces]